MTEHGARVVLVVVGAIAVGIVLANLVSFDEPGYEGKPLSLWLDELDSQEPNQAQVALEAIGPKAIPFLFDKVRCESSLAQRCYRATWMSLPVAIQKSLPVPQQDGPLHERIFAALRLWERPAIPAVIVELADPDDNVRLVAANAIAALGSLASAAVPSLSKLVNDPNGEVRCAAVVAFRYMGPARVQAVPLLMGALKDHGLGLDGTNTVTVRHAAAQVLGKIGPAANAAMPELTGMLRDMDSSVRQQAALALWRIGHDTNLVTRTAAEVRHASDPLTCKAFLETLGEMGPAARTASPVLLTTITNSARLSGPLAADIARAARSALRKVEAEIAPVGQGPDLNRPEAPQS